LREAARPRILLARRRRLLRDLGVPFSVLVPDVDERSLPGSSRSPRPAAGPRQGAGGRPGARPRSTAQWVIGADTVVVLDGEILGKPLNPRHAARMLARLSGRTHEVLTGVALVRPPVDGRAPPSCAAGSR